MDKEQLQVALGLCESTVPLRWLRARAGSGKTSIIKLLLQLWASTTEQVCWVLQPTRVLREATAVEHLTEQARAPVPEFHQGPRPPEFHQGSTKGPPEVHQRSTRGQPGAYQGSTTGPPGVNQRFIRSTGSGSTRGPPEVYRGVHQGFTRGPPESFHQGSTRDQGSTRGPPEVHQGSTRGLPEVQQSGPTRVEGSTRGPPGIRTSNPHQGSTGQGSTRGCRGAPGIRGVHSTRFSPGTTPAEFHQGSKHTRGHQSSTMVFSGCCSSVSPDFCRGSCCTLIYQSLPESHQMSTRDSCQRFA